MKTFVLGTAVAVAASAVILSAQQSPQPQPRPASPRGTAQAEVGGQWVKGERRDTYQGGKWIEIDYGRPLKRGRDIWGSGGDYGKALNAGAPVWRAGANQSTRLKTDAPLMIGDKNVPAGEYSLFIELKSATEWTLIVSSWGAKATGNDQTPDTLWGSFNYTPAKDVARAPMVVGKSQVALEQLTWGFCDLTAAGGKMFIAWDTVNAVVPFTLAK
jgi:hypothetical protein